jgi:hypothetical protein
VVAECAESSVAECIDEVAGGLEGEQTTTTPDTGLPVNISREGSANANEAQYAIGGRPRRRASGPGSESNPGSALVSRRTVTGFPLLSRTRISSRGAIPARATNSQLSGR